MTTIGFKIGISLFIATTLGLPVYCLSATEANPTQLVEKSYNVYDFDKIVADGYFKLEIVQQPIRNAYLTTSTYADNPIQITVQDRTLYLMAKYNYRPNIPQPAVHIRLDHLSSLSVYGPTTVYANSLSTPGLTLSAEGYGRVDLKNVGDLRAIHQSGNNAITVTGIKATRLDLDMSGFGKATLQGTADQVYASIYDTVSLKARDLLAKEISIQAKNRAEAYIHPTQSLKAFTDQSSVIYYYKQPGDVTTHPMASGNVLPINTE